MMTANLEKRDVKRMFFYVDIIVIGVFCLSLVLLVRDAYVAGWLDSYVVQREVNVSFWNMLRDAAFLVGSLSWIFYRYFKNSVKVMQNPWV
ncbi:MAG TPA: hypothetical protein VGR28_06965 [Candidatus Thermoplasmatota archaeon]|jgi:hypothetical protein|nr:hypothetical protein [Candidatus Thermoplasmatota archaeon]